MSQRPSGDPWGSLALELQADVRRVSDRLRNLSQTRLAGPVAPPEPGGPPYSSRAQAARDVAQALADTAAALEAAAAGVPAQLRAVPTLSDLAAGDQVAVTGHDLLAAICLVGPDVEVRLGEPDRGPAQRGVDRAARMLADLRRRL